MYKLNRFVLFKHLLFDYVHDFHGTWQIPGSFICSCPENFHIHDDKRTCVRDYCVDLDNSQLNKTRCSHECSDEHEGSFNEVEEKRRIKSFKYENHF